MGKLSVGLGIACAILAGLCVIQQRAIIRQSANLLKVTNELHATQDARKADTLAHELKDKAVRDAKAYAKIQKGELAGIVESDPDDCDFVADIVRLLYPEAYGHCDHNAASQPADPATGTGTTASPKPKTDPAQAD